MDWFIGLWDFLGTLFRGKLIKYFFGGNQIKMKFMFPLPKAWKIIIKNYFMIESFSSERG